MDNTELRRIKILTSINTYYASADGTLFRQMKNTPREYQLTRKGCTLFKYKGIWLNPIKGYKDSKGYLRVDIDDKTYAIHRLIGLTFLPIIDGKDQINHKDGNRTNNCSTNLEWCNSQDNIVHAFDVLKRKPSYGKTGKFGERNLAKIARNDLVEYDILNTDLSYSEIAKKHQITLGIVKGIAKIRKVQRLTKG